MLKITTAFLCLFLICCKQPDRATASQSFKDSIVREYLRNIDSLEFYDTTNYDFRVLRAYLKNDVSFLEKVQKDIEYERKYGHHDFYFDSCASLRKLSDLNVDKVYRFHHSGAFCFYNQFVTISKKEDSILLHYVEISFSPDGKKIELWGEKGNRIIGPGCKIEKEFSKALIAKDWQILEESLDIADFWGLKPNNPRSGLDGSSWTIEGFSKRPQHITEQQIHRVYRWSPTNSFAELGSLFMKLSGEKGKCF